MTFRRLKSAVRANKAINWAELKQENRVIYSNPKVNNLHSNTTESPTMEFVDVVREDIVNVNFGVLIRNPKNKFKPL